MANAYISLGSNIEPEQNLCTAIHALRARFGLIELSPVYRCEAVGFDGPAFLNAAARIETDLEPLALDTWLHGLEDRQGRDRSGPRFSSRSLDIDLVLYDQLVLHGPGNLQLPRPELDSEAFVLQPMVDIAPDLIHPTHRVSLAKMLEQLAPQTTLTSIEIKCAELQP